MQGPSCRFQPVLREVDPRSTLEGECNLGNPERTFTPGVKSDRIPSVDVFKLVAMLAVILLHTEPFGFHYFQQKSDLFKFMHIIIDNLARFAVPFFFVISGYFWGTRLQAGRSINGITLRMIKHFSYIFVLWSCIYLLPYNISSISQYGLLGPLKLSYWSLCSAISDPTVIFHGTKGHLWFLVGLICAVSISYLFIRYNMTRTLIAISISLYIVGVMAGSYSQSKVGINIHFYTRNGPFCATLFFVSGYILSRYKPTHKWQIVGFYTFVIGLLMHFSEIYYLWQIYGVYPHHHDYVFGTYFMGLGVAIMSLSNHRLFINDKLAMIGKLTLGIYLIHFIFVDLLAPITEALVSPAWEVTCPFIVLLASIISVSVLSKYRVTRSLVL